LSSSRPLSQKGECNDDGRTSSSGAGDLAAVDRGWKFDLDGGSQDRPLNQLD
jgi:hypothetical protein